MSCDDRPCELGAATSLSPSSVPGLHLGSICRTNGHVRILLSYEPVCISRVEAVYALPAPPPAALHPDLGRVDAHKRLFSSTELEMTDSFQESSRGHLDAGRGRLVGRSTPIKQARVGISHLF